MSEEEILEKQIKEEIKEFEQERSNTGNAFCYWAVQQALFDDFEDNKEDMIFPETNDQGIDFFWIDKENRIIYLGQSKMNRDIDHNIVNDLLKSIDFLENRGIQKSDILEEASIEFRQFKIENKNSLNIKFLFFTMGDFTDTAKKARISHKIINDEIIFYDRQKLIELFVDNKNAKAGRGVKEIEILVDKNKLYPFTNENSKVTDSLVCAIPAKQIAEIFEKHGEGIFSLNVRRGLPKRNAVNTGMQNTLKNDIQRNYFYFYNNGLCMTCQKIIKIDKKDKIILKLIGANIVNGGQTTRQIYLCREYLEGTYVLLKIFESQDREIITKIAFYNNSQTAVTNADLLSNDPIMIRLYDACKLNGFYFERQRGLLDDEYPNLPSIKKTFGKEWKQKIINPKELGQVYLAFMGLPAIARGKSKLIFELDGSEAKFKYIFQKLSTDKLIFLWKLWKILNQKIKTITKDTDITILKYGRWLILQWFGLRLKEDVINRKIKKDPNKILETCREVIEESSNEIYLNYVKEDFEKSDEELIREENKIKDFFEEYFGEAFNIIKELFSKEKKDRESLGKAFSYNDYVKGNNAQEDLFKEFYRIYASDLRRLRKPTD